MAKIVVNGAAVVITSTLKVEDIKTVQKYRPDSLTLYKGEGKDKTPVFRAGLTGSYGTIGNCGVSFGGTNADGYAVATLLLPDNLPADKVAEYVSDNVGVHVLKLNELETQIPAVLAEIAAEKATIAGMVTIQ